MWLVPVGYIVYVIGLSLMCHQYTNIDNGVAWNPLHQLLAFAPLVLCGLQPKSKVWLYGFYAISVVVYYFIFPESIVTRFLVNTIEACGFDVVRLCVYYDQLSHQTQDIESAKTGHHWHGMVSNLGNILQLRAHTVYKMIPNRLVMYSSMAFVVAGTALTTPWTAHEKHILFNDEIKIRRMLLQSGIVFVASACKTLASRQVEPYTGDSQFWYDVAPLCVTFGVVWAGKNVFKLHYRVYSMVCPIVSLLCSAAVVSTRNLDVPYVHNALYAIFQTMHYVIFDPVRLVLHVTHEPRVTSLWCACEMASICVASVFSYYAHVWFQYPLVILHVVWIWMAHFSKRYYLKDHQRMECINRLQSS